MRLLCLVGAGNIAQIHAEALQSVAGVRIAAVVDPNIEAARRLAAVYGVSRAYPSVSDAMAAGGMDAAHILTPPNLHHDSALPFVVAGKPVLIEKPMGVGTAECEALLAAARGSGASIGVNQNAVFHPAFLAARRRIAAGEFGRPRFVECVYNVPLRQLAARQFAHWMFDSPGNILLEQAVHPLSQIVALAGPVRDLRAMADEPVAIAPDLDFYPAASVTLACEHLPAQLRFAVGQSFPFWQVSVVCDDGVVVADIIGNRTFACARTRWMDAVDNAASGGRTAVAIAWSGCRNALDYGLSLVRLRGRSDPFFRSMRGSIAAFHAALDGRAPYETDGLFGATLIGVCETIRDRAFAARAPRAPATRSTERAETPVDVAVLGGTGFIGAETVRRLVSAGQHVSVMARSVRNLPAIFHHPRVALRRGDIRDEAAVARAIGVAPVVINLAHGGGGTSFEEVQRAMVGGAENVARACRAQGVRRLVHVGSIASLYLGPDAGTVTGATPSDPRADERGDYSRAKAMCDRMLLQMHAREGLPVVILRPGLVVGEGTSPFHSGLGFFNNEQHCIGWNVGRNPLPFVLVGDVAEAIVLASLAEGVEGRCYNLVGDVRPSAREYVSRLAHALGRPLRFHPQYATALWLVDLGKWVIKRIGGREVPLPSRRDLISRGLAARFDCGDAKRDLAWRPVADPAEFARQAFAVHVR
ncbi:NAD-dependent epimerase/dehydratase family protein [Candidatus Binatia bacterium]|nr:NAD-dependent epimerase/dehydratase family protein [Candidatus Binatia bacterium]